MHRPLLVALLLGWSLPSRAADVQVAVAANFALPMQKIATAFERKTGHRVLLSSGATGKFYTQIVNGAPFEILLAADSKTPERLEKEGLAVPGSRFTYAIGALALWSAQDHRVDNKGDILRHGKFDHLALANPNVAPYGQAAMETLRALQLEQALAPRWVMGENIAQAYQFVSTGNAELGFVALSQIIENGKLKSGSVWIVPARLHRPLRQDAILLQAGKNNPAARALLSYLQSDAAKAMIKASGYTF